MQAGIKNTAISLLLVFCWLMTPLWIWMQVNHHWFAAASSTLAAWSVLASLDPSARRLGWPLVAGAAAGATSMFVPNVGALVMLASLSGFSNVRQNLDKLLAYLFGCALMPAAALAYLFKQGSLTAAFDDVILFTTQHYGSANAVPFGFLATTLTRPNLYIFPLAGILALLLCAREWQGYPPRQSVLGVRRVRFRRVPGLLPKSRYLAHRVRCALGVTPASRCV